VSQNKGREGGGSISQPTKKEASSAGVLRREDQTFHIRNPSRREELKKEKAGKEQVLDPEKEGIMENGFHQRTNVVVNLEDVGCERPSSGVRRTKRQAKFRGVCQE